MSLHDTAHRVETDSSTAEVFQNDWKLYRKMVDNNFLFHREAYGALHNHLRSEFARPFRFLDIACGDASASVKALGGTTIAHYHGIDFSAAALDIARENLAALECPASIERNDYLDALAAGLQSTDVAWIGLSLHHLRQPEKAVAMGKVREALAPKGQLLIYENTSPDGEDRSGWMARWDLQRASWTAYSEREWEAMSSHVHAADFPETDRTWHKLGRAAGFSETREIFAAPSDLFRLYCFSA